MGVGVGVLVGVKVAVGVFVLVGVNVAVLVGDGVLVNVGVFDGVLVGPTGVLVANVKPPPEPLVGTLVTGAACVANGALLTLLGVLVTNCPCTTWGAKIKPTMNNSAGTRQVTIRRIQSSGSLVMNEAQTQLGNVRATV